MTTVEEEKFLSRHMTAIPFIGPKPNGLNLLDLVMVDHRVHGPLFGSKVLPVGSLLAPGMVEPAKRLELNGVLENPSRPDFPDFATSGCRLLGLGMGAFGGGATATAAVSFDFEGSSTSVMMLEKVTEENIVRYPNLRTILTVPESFGKIMEVQDQLLTGGSGTKKVLVGVVTKSIRGTVHIGSATRTSVEGSLEVSLPTLLGVTVAEGGGDANANANKEDAKDVGGTGHIGACFLIFMLQTTSKNPETIQVYGSRSVQRIDVQELTYALNWAKLGPVRSTFARNQPGPASFYTGVGVGIGGSPSFEDAESFDEAVAVLTSRAAGMSVAHGQVIDDEDGHAIVNVQAKTQAIDSPDRLGNKVWFNGSINFLYRAPKKDLAQIYSDLKNKKSVQIEGYEVNYIVPAVQFDNSRCLPFHYTPLQTDEQEGKLPGAILRQEDACMVLHIIDPLGKGTKVGGEAVTFNTKGWHIEDDIDYVGVDDHEKQDELRQAGYHRLVDEDANLVDVKHLGLQAGSYVVMGRQELKRDLAEMSMSASAEVFRRLPGKKKEENVYDYGKKATGTASTATVSTTSDLG